MREHRRFVRVRPSGLISKFGKIIVDAKAPAVDCTIIDISAGGACLQVNNPERIPKRFELLHGGTRKKCSTIWQKGSRLGVSF
jgi:hypothetical protein